MQGVQGELQDCRTGERNLSHADPLNDNPSSASAIVAMNEHGLLPDAKCQFTFDERDDQRRAKKSGSNMSVAIAISLGYVVIVIHIAWRDTLHGRLEIGDYTGFKFQTGYGASRTCLLYTSPSPRD